MKIPYGDADFGKIRRQGYFYADKTPFLPELERAESGYRHLLFLRPRRFGKSTLVSLLEHYYDIHKKDQFDELFKGLWIHEHPTPEKNKYLVLALDFSGVATDGGQETLRETFLLSVRQRVRTFLLRYGERVPMFAPISNQLDTYHYAEALIGDILSVVAATPYQMYLLIDEYDHFANRLLSGTDQKLYDEAIVKRTGFVRTFYATLKAATQTGALARMFVTGVTPLMFDDLSSGFNISTNISMVERFNAMVGFTRADVERAVDEFLAARPHLAQLPELGDRSRLFEALEGHYDGYRFSRKASERVFNSDLVLYFLSQVDSLQGYPTEMLDRNVRTDYSHLMRIGGLTGTQAKTRRELLESILSDGYVRSDLVSQFGIQSLPTRNAYLSLLYYLGMLTLADKPQEALGYHLEIPNRVIRELQWEHLSLMLQEQTPIAIRLDDLELALESMSSRGDIQLFLSLFHSQVLKRIGIKDTRQLGEKTIKLLFMTYVSLGKSFHPLSEKELAQGYCDLFLGPTKGIANAHYSWLIEFKYLPTHAGPAQVEAAFEEAAKQVERYASDEALLPLLVGDRELKAGMIVFQGVKKYEFRPWPPEPKAKATPAKKAAARKAKPATKKAKPVAKRARHVAKRAKPVAKKAGVRARKRR